MDVWTVNKDGTRLLQMTQGLASETKNQCTFGCHSAAWSPDGSRLAYANGAQTQVFTMRSDNGTDQVKMSHDDPTGRSHFPSYLADGRLAYVTEHVNPGQSWTDIWAVTPGNSPELAALLQDVQVQGPFEFSSDGQRLLFSSPRNGNFEIYIATLDASGKEALKKVLSETQLAPALAAAGHPSGLSTAGRAQSAQSNPVAAGSNPSGGETGILPASASPYVLALGGLAVIWLAAEGIMIARRRSRRRSTKS